MNNKKQVPELFAAIRRRSPCESMAYGCASRVNLPDVVFFSLRGAALPTGARKCKRACIGHRQERPAADSPTAEPTQRRCSDCGKERANVTGKSARAVGMHPSWELGLDSTEAATRWSGQAANSHPAEPMANDMLRRA